MAHFTSISQCTLQITMIQTFALIKSIITARKRSLGQGNMFTGVCLATGEDAWSIGEDAWSRGGVPGPGGCLVETPPDGYCCGRYASYWNVFLFCNLIKISDLALGFVITEAIHNLQGFLGISALLVIIMMFYLFFVIEFTQAGAGYLDSTQNIEFVNCLV